MSRLTALLLTALASTALTNAHDPRQRDRGDVPGWVLVTVMTAGIVVGIAAIAQPTLVQMFQQAITAVQAP